ncbi:MAG: LemA family protein [Chitinophagales bacterium]
MATTTPSTATTKRPMGRWIGIGIIVVLVLYLISLYNGIVKADETVKEKWGNVESAYKRRFDLIDNLVSTVKGAADFEKSTLTEIVEARSRATGINIDPTNATPEQLKAFSEAQNQVGSALSRLLVVVENYPALTATQNFRDLQSQLEGTENRINTERIRYNEAVKEYNVKIRRFPATIVARIMGLETRAAFDAPEETETAPKVDFEKKTNNGENQ